MAKIEITKIELVWPGKYNEDGKLKEVPRVSLPFQVIERVNESRATRQARKCVQPTLFDIYEGKEGDTFDEGWRNKLIWGDNLLVMSSLLEKFAGKIDLIYIDPPFATGADFTFTAPIGESDEEVFKEQSVIEEKAYRDTWGRGIESYLQMMYERLMIMRELLSKSGTIYIHLGAEIVHYLKALCDDIFGKTSYLNQIVWRFEGPQSPSPTKFATKHEVILRYAKDSSSVVAWDLYYDLKVSRDKGRYQIDEKGRYFYTTPKGDYSDESLAELQKQGRILHTRSGNVRIKHFVDLDSEGNLVRKKKLADVWDDIPSLGLAAQSRENTGFQTQKPEKLLSRIIRASSCENSLVADFFCGSGTTLAVAEKLGRRWIGCDMSRWAIHVTRKRLLDIPNCKPFEVLNLGKYERQYWQVGTFGDSKDKTRAEQALYEYLAFILRLYGAQPISGTVHLHGKKGKAMVHIGAVDAPVTIDEITQALDECVALRQTELHVLGWDWEMGLAGPNNDVRQGGVMHEVARQRGVKLVLLQIPREVMEQQAAKGDVKFYELAYFQVAIRKPRPRTVVLELTDFASPNMAELIPDEIRAKIKKWSDYIDYWAVDWDFQNDTFMQGWVAYRTRKERRLPLASDPHTYEKPGRYRILVKVVDIFGNDTSQAFDVEVE